MAPDTAAPPTTDCPHDFHHAPSWGSGWGEITWLCGLCGAEATAQIDMDTVKWGAPDGASDTAAAQLQAAHDADSRAEGFPWCDTCQHAAVYLEGHGFLHSTPEHPFGHPRNSDPFAGHEVTMREWNAVSR